MRKRKSRFVQALVWCLIRLELPLVLPLFYTIPLLPRKAVMGLSRFLGRAVYRAAKTERRVALANLDLAFGDTRSAAEKQAIALASLQTFFLTLLDFAWFSRRSRERLDRWLKFDSSLDSYFTHPPVIVATAHFGNWEVQGQGAALMGAPLLSVAAMFPSEPINRFMTRCREQHGMTVVPREGALKTLMRTLKKGGRVALLMDQNTRISEGGMFVRFFGTPATMSPAASVLAIRTGAAIMPVVCRAMPDGSYLGSTPGRIEPAPGETVEQLNQKIADAFESEIRKHPDQWLWMYRRWKYVPEGDKAERYPFYAHPATKSNGEEP